MSNCTAERAERQTEGTTPSRPSVPYYLWKREQGSSSPKLTAAQQELAALAWSWAEKIIEKYRRKHTEPDYEGFAAERIVRAIPRFEAPGDPERTIPYLRQWISRHIHGACLDAMRASRPIGPTFRSEAERRRKRRIPAVIPFSVREHAARRRSRKDFADHADFTPAAMAVGDQPDWLQRDALLDIAKGASAVERYLIVAYYMTGITMKEIGENLGLSETRISQMHSALIARLRENLTARASA